MSKKLKNFQRFLRLNTPPFISGYLTIVLVNFLYIIGYKWSKPLLLFYKGKFHWLLKWKDSQLHTTSPFRIYWYLNPRGLEGRLDSLRRRYSLPGKVDVEEGDVVLDIGANVGEYSLSVVEDASKIIAFEPDTSVYKCLKLNTSSSSKIVSQPHLLWSHSESINFYCASKDADSSIFLPPKAKGINQSLSIEGIALDDLLLQMGEKRVDFLKMDAEGAEPEVLKGAVKTLKILKKIAIDCGPERLGKDTIQETKSLLEEAGFKTQENNNILFGWR